MANIRDDLSNGRRVYVQTRFGEAAIERLRGLGAKWDPEAKCWWVGATKRAAVETALAEAAREDSRTGGKERPDAVVLVGRCRYKGRVYYARYVGPTKRGYSCRLVTLDHSLDFWTPCAEPGDSTHDGSGDVAAVVKRYEGRRRWYRGRETVEPVTLADIQDFVERQRDPLTHRGTCSGCGRAIEDASRNPAMGGYCGECAFDEYDR